MAVMTQCCIVELYKLGPEHQDTVDIAKRFERRKCNHREAIVGDDCIRSVVGTSMNIVPIPADVLNKPTGDANKHRYAVATQSTPLRDALRAIPGVPILHINRVVLVLEPPSQATLRAKSLVR